MQGASKEAPLVVTAPPEPLMSGPEGKAEGPTGHAQAEASWCVCHEHMRVVVPGGGV